MAISDSEAFTDACGFVMPLGEHKGETIALVGSHVDGLLYLDWLIGQKWVDGRWREALESYLVHPVISRQLEAHLDDWPV